MTQDISIRLTKRITACAMPHDLACISARKLKRIWSGTESLSADLAHRIIEELDDLAPGDAAHLRGSMNRAKIERPVS